MVQPDNLIVCDEPLEGRFLDNAPRVIFEILSPATIIKDTRLKYELYESAGVENYVIVDPERKHVTHYRLGSEGYEKTAEGERVELRFELPGCVVTFDASKIWDRKSGKLKTKGERQRTRALSHPLTFSF